VFEKKKNNFYSYYLIAAFSVLLLIKGVKLGFFCCPASLHAEFGEFLNQGKEIRFIFHLP